MKPRTSLLLYTGLVAVCGLPACAQVVLPTPLAKTVSLNDDGTLRAPTTLWTANASAIASAAAAGFADASIGMGKISGLGAALDAKAPLASPTFTGLVSADNLNIATILYFGENGDTTVIASAGIHEITLPAASGTLVVSASPTFTGTASFFDVDIGDGGQLHIPATGATQQDGNIFLNGNIQVLGLNTITPTELSYLDGVDAPLLTEGNVGTFLAGAEAVTIDPNFAGLRLGDGTAHGFLDVSQGSGGWQIIADSASSTSNEAFTIQAGGGNMGIILAPTGSGVVQITHRLVLGVAPTYADDAAADADSGLPSGGLYRLTGSRVVYRKP